jgi:hypothetical protein
MFKVGQTLKVTRELFYGNKTFYEGDLAKIIHMGNNMATIEHYNNAYTAQWGIEHIGKFFKIKNNFEPPKTEIEWLDRVKENFKYG